MFPPDLMRGTLCGRANIDTPGSPIITRPLFPCVDFCADLSRDKIEQQAYLYDSVMTENDVR